MKRATARKPLPSAALAEFPAGAGCDLLDRRYMPTMAADILSSASDLFDPYAFDGDPSQPDPINWSDEVTNGISLASPIDWRHGDPGFSAPALALVPRRSLREHISEVDAIADTIEAMDDEDLTEEARARLAAMLLGAIAGTKNKVDATTAVMARLEHRAEAQKAERDLLDQGLKRSLHQLDRLGDYVLQVLDGAGLDRIEGDVSTLTRRRNPASVVPDGTVSGPLAREFVREPKPGPWSEDKTAIRVAIAAGRQVPGFACYQSVRLVRS
jgi:Siphovirus Gp157